MEDKMKAKSLRERLADLCHRQWSGWMQYLFENGEFNDDGTWTMTALAVKRWRRQMNTSYQELSDQEQESYRSEADKFIDTIGTTTVYNLTINNTR